MRRALVAALLGGLAAACASTTDDLRGVAELPPLDRAVLVSGGAFFAGASPPDGTFAPRDAADPDDGGEAGAARREAIPFAAIVDVLERGRVCQRLVADADPARRARLVQQLDERVDDPAVIAFLQDARDRGFDLLLLVEELQDGVIDSQGTNGRWPVTFATWILLGVGALIPDRTFESRATLRVSLRELQTGRKLYDLLLVPGPVELALTERTDFWGLLLSIVVPPFWVGDDRAAVTASVRQTAQRRLLLSLARDLKSEVLRRRLFESEAAAITLVPGDGGPHVEVRSREALSVAQLRGPGFEQRAATAAFADALLASRRLVDGRFRYRAPLPERAGGGAFQVVVGTLRGGVASATFTERSAR